MPTTRDSHGSQLQNFIFLYSTALLAGVGWGMVLPAIPTLTDFFGISVGAAAQTVTAYAAGRFAGTPVSGVMLDRLGPRSMMVSGALTTSVAAFFAFLTPWFSGLIASLFLIGAGDAVWAMGREAAGIDLTQQNQRGRVLSAFHGVHNGGLTLGPLMGGILTEMLGFRAVFIAYAASAGFAVWLGLAVHTRTPLPSVADTAVPPDAGGTATLNSWLQRMRDLFRQIDPGLRPTYIVLIVATLTSFMFRLTVQSMLPLYAGKQLGFTPLEIGFLFTISGAVVFGMIVPAGFVLDKIGRKWATVPSNIIPALAFVAIPFATTFPQLAVLVCLTGVANGLSLGSLATSTYDVVPRAVRGRLQAARRTLADLGALFGPLLGGMLANAFNPGTPFLVFAPVIALSAFLLAFVAKETLERN